MAHCALWLTLIALGILTGVNYSITIVLGTMVQLTFERSGSVVLQCIHCFAYELCVRAYVCAFVWVRTCVDLQTMLLWIFFLILMLVLSTRVASVDRRRALETNPPCSSCRSPDLEPRRRAQMAPPRVRGAPAAPRLPRALPHERQGSVPHDPRHVRPASASRRQAALQGLPAAALQRHVRLSVLGGVWTEP